MKKISSKTYKIGSVRAEGVCFKLGQKPLVALITKNGYIGCGYIDIAVSEKCGDSAARVAGVSSVKEMLDAKLAAVTKQAAQRGLKAGMECRQALMLL